MRACSSAIHHLHIYASHDPNGHETEKSLIGKEAFFNSARFTSTRSFTYACDFIHVDVYVRSCNCEVIPTAMECVFCFEIE